MKRKSLFCAVAAVCFLFLSFVAAAADFAWELRCEQQYTTAELPDLIWSQGSTPLINARVYLRGKAQPPDAGVSVQMMIAPTATSEKWAVVTNSATNATGYLLQWPTVGTNTTAAAPWYYTVYFLKDGHRYWTGSGNLWIEETTSTADGLIWQEIISGDLSWVSNRLAEVEADLHGIAGEVATNALEIAELEESVGNISTNYLPLTGGTIKGKLSAGYLASAFGAFSQAFGLSAMANSDYSFVAGAWTRATNLLSFVWSGNDGSTAQHGPLYSSHGDGTFNVNPAGGLGGFYVGETTLQDTFNALYGECAGGWRYPNVWKVGTVVTGAPQGVSTSVVWTATQDVYNVRQRTGYTSQLRGWAMEPLVLRSSVFEDTVQWSLPDDDGETVFLDGDNLLFAPGIVAGDLEDGTTFNVRGTLGSGAESWVADTVLVYDSSRQASTNATGYEFLGPAPGSLLENAWTNVLEAAQSEEPQKSVHLRTWPEGYGDGQHPVANGWNTNFWGLGLADFSCVSYFACTPSGVVGGVYRPIAMVTPRHGVVANHWRPPVGVDCLWVTRSGAVVTNRVVEYKTETGDLGIARMEYAFDTNDVLPAKTFGGMWGGYFTGARLKGNNGVPVLSFDCAERGYLVWWRQWQMVNGPTSAHGANSMFKIARADGIRFGNWNAVGGDSGSPIFCILDGEAILIGGYTTAHDGVLASAERINQTIAESWPEDAERAEEFDFAARGWSNPDIPVPPN